MWAPQKPEGGGITCSEGLDVGTAWDDGRALIQWVLQEQCHQMFTQATHLPSIGTGPEQRAEVSWPALTVLGVRTGSSVHRMVRKAASQVSAGNTEPALKPERVREGFLGGGSSELVRLKGGEQLARQEEQVCVFS